VSEDVDYIGTMRVAGKSMEEVEKSIDDGFFTVLFDADGKFIEQSFNLVSLEAPPS
jgi:hypothetical protein